MKTIRRLPAGAPVALLALAVYLTIVWLMAPGAVRTGIAAILQIAAFAVAMAVILQRLQRVDADPETTRRLFELAGALLMASPLLAVAVHMAR